MIADSSKNIGIHDFQTTPKFIDESNHAILLPRFETHRKKDTRFPGWVPRKRQAWDRWIYEEGGQVVDDITVVSW